MEEFLRNWVPLLVSILAFGTSGWGILQGPARKNAETIKAINDTLTRLIEKIDERVDTVERVQAAHTSQLEQLPDKDSLHELQIVVERMNSDVRVMGETLKGVKETSNLMRDWLLEKGVR